MVRVWGVLWRTRYEWKTLQVVSPYGWVARIRNLEIARSTESMASRGRTKFQYISASFQHHFSIISAWFQHHFSHFMFSSKMLCILSWWSQRSSCAGNGRCWWRRTINVIIVQGQKCLPSTYFETSILLILWSYDRSNVQRIIDYSAKSIFLSLRGSRVAALEMELNLVRSRFARETVMRGPWSHWTGCSDARGVSGNRVWICMVLHELWVKESLAIISRRYYLLAWLSLWAFWPEPVAT